MNRRIATTLGALALFVACAAQPKAPSMAQYEEARGDTYAEVVRQRFPALYQEAEVHHAKATEAYNDKEQEAMEHHAKVAMLWWQAAKTSSEAVDLKEHAAEANNDFNMASKRLASATKKQIDAKAAVTRLEEIIALSGKLGDSEKSNAARQALNDALATLKSAEAVNARTHAPEKFAQAEAKFHAATEALTAAKLADAESLAIEAKVAAEAAKTASAGKYKAEQATLAFDQRRRALFDAAASVAGVERSITEGGVVLTIRKVFPSGKVEIDPDRFDTFNAVAKLGKDFSEFSLIVEGHTDSRGNDSRNLQLSEGRAKAVVTYLATQGLAPGRMNAAGKGEGSPVAENTSKAGRAQNRRIEILFAQGQSPG